jgi:hypothetical protein
MLRKSCAQLELLVLHAILRLEDKIELGRHEITRVVYMVYKPLWMTGFQLPAGLRGMFLMQIRVNG